MDIKTTIRYPFTPIEMATIKKVPSFGEDVEKLKPLCIIGGNENGISAIEDIMTVP